MEEEYPAHEWDQPMGFDQFGEKEKLHYNQCGLLHSTGELNVLLFKL